MFLEVKDGLSADFRMSDNHILRYCNGHDWITDNILEKIQIAEEMRKSYDCDHLSSELFTELIDMKTFVYNGAHDRIGRPIFWMRFENWVTTTADERETVRFLCWQLDRISVDMPRNVDQLIMVYDFYNTGYSNFSLNHLK